LRDLLFSMPDSVFFIGVYLFLILGVGLAFKMTISIIKHGKNNKLFIVLLLYNCLNFYIIYDLLTVPPTVSSGNGNPFVPYLFFSALIYLVLCIAIFIEFKQIMKNCNTILKIFHFFTALLVGATSLVLQLAFISKVNMQLTHHMSDWWNWWKDIHLNSLYFNLYTFLLGICISILLAIWVTLLTKESDQSGGINLH
jgi:hypothetical protein